MSEEKLSNFNLLDWFDETKEEDIFKEGAELLLEIQTIIDKDLAIWAERKKKLNSVLYKKYSQQAANVRVGDSGVIHLKEEETGIIITCNARKEVAWNQELMTTICNKIVEAEDDPRKYMKFVLEVPEKLWNSWGKGSWQQTSFLPARTVKIRDSFVIVPPKETKG